MVRTFKPIASPEGLAPDAPMLDEHGKPVPARPLAAIGGFVPAKLTDSTGGSASNTLAAVTAAGTITDSSGGVDPGNNTIAAVVDPTLSVLMANLGPVLAATTTGKAAQKDLNGISPPATMASIVNPDVPRNVVLTITDGNTSISAYQITVAGKAPDGTSITEVFTFASGLTPTGSKVFATVTSVTIDSMTGSGAGDTLDLGYGVKLGVPLPFGSTGLSIVNLSVDGVQEAASATDTTNNSFTSTTAPNGTKLLKVFYSFTGLATTTLKAAIAQLAAKVNTTSTAVTSIKNSLASLAAKVNTLLDLMRSH